MSRDRFPDRGKNKAETGPSDSFASDVEKGSISQENYDTSEQVQEPSGRLEYRTEFLQRITVLSDNTKELSSQIDQLQGLHNQILTSLDPNSVQEEFDRRSGDASSKLEEIKAQHDFLKDDVAKGGTFAHMKRQVLEAQRNKIKELILKFQEATKRYRDALHEYTVKQLRIIFPDLDDKTLALELANANTSIFQDVLKTANRKGKAKSVLEEAQKRHNDILTIERKVAQLAELFQELNSLVSLDQPIVDKIVAEAAEAKAEVKEGHEEVKLANKYAVSYRQKKWWAVLLGVLIVIAIIIVVVVTQVVEKAPVSSAKGPTATVTQVSTASAPSSPTTS